MIRLFLLIPTLLLATPAQVILLRHAENQLKGRERASAFVPFFQGSPAVLANGLPAALYASAAALQTLSPLSEKIDTPIQQFSNPATLASDILNNPDYEGKTIVVCSTHAQLPSLAALLGAKKAPKKWDEDTYDRLWILNFNDEGQVAFQDLPQKLLYGDSR